MAEITLFMHMTLADRIRVVETATEPPALEIGHEMILFPPTDPAHAKAFFEELKTAAEQACQQARRQLNESLAWPPSCKTEATL